MQLVTNGCSFTEGFNLPQGQFNWPQLLGARLNASTTNLAIGGSSNARIFRTTIEYLNAHPTPDLVIIGWTVNDRSELSSSRGTYLRLNSVYCSPDSAYIDSNDKFDHVHKFWLTELQNNYINLRNWLNSVVHLQDYFLSKNIKFKFFVALGVNYIREFLNETDVALNVADEAWQWRDKTKFEPFRDIHTQYQELSALVKKIDLKHWPFEGQITMQQYLTEQNYETDNTGHFLEPGYCAWTDVLQGTL